MSLPYVAPLDRVVFLTATNELNTIKESKDRMDQIQKRALYVFDKIAEIYDRSYSWVTYDNCNLEIEGSAGKYDYERYLEEFKFYSDLDDAEYLNRIIPLYYNSFPSRFIYTDFEDEVTAELQEFKNNADKKRQKSKDKREHLKKREIERAKIRPDIIKSITAKLTEEELSFILFK